MITSHTTWDHLQKKDPFSYSSKHKLAMCDDEMEPMLKTLETEDQLEAREQIRLIIECVEKDNVSEIEGITFKLFYFAAVPLQVIADIMDRSINAIRTIKTRALSKVKDCIGKK